MSLITVMVTGVAVGAGLWAICIGMPKAKPSKSTLEGVIKGVLS